MNRNKERERVFLLDSGFVFFFYGYTVQILFLFSGLILFFFCMLCFFILF